jgi:hypothetical protein
LRLFCAPAHRVRRTSRSSVPRSRPPRRAARDRRGGDSRSRRPAAALLPDDCRCAGAGSHRAAGRSLRDLRLWRRLPTSCRSRPRRRSSPPAVTR